MKDLRVVIPAYNEEKSIGDVIDQVRDACPEAEVVVVDDASKDRTGQIARGRGVTVVRNPINRGKGGATKVGFKYLSGRDIKFYAFIDSDKTYPATNIPELYRLCNTEKADIAVGSRFLCSNQGMPLIRKIGNTIFAKMLSFYTGGRTTDTSTGLRVINDRILDFVDLLPDGLDFDTCMTATALFKELNYHEVPISYRCRVGTSKLNIFKDGYKFLKVIMNATRQYKPFLFYITLGIPFVVVDSVVQLVTLPRRRHWFHNKK